MLNTISRKITAPLPLVLLLTLTTGIASAEDCLECHKETEKAFSSSSHHVQGIKLTSVHCYACHWEAAADGGINKKYHQKKRDKIDLVIWRDGIRPEQYSAGKSAVVFAPTAIATKNERKEIAKISLHCLGCHSDCSNDISPFGDGKTPRQYAWDRQSIASRYTNKGTASWGKYSAATTNRKSSVTKAFSAHGNAGANQGGWSPADGYDEAIPTTRGGTAAKNIECFDCHNSHGSTVAGITSGYQSFDGNRSGGLLKDTSVGKSGYKSLYTPSGNSDPAANNPYSSGAGLCFDCHETLSPGSTPWGYRTTFGAKEPILGYKDTLRFGNGSKGSTARYSDRQSRANIVSSHLKAGRFLSYSVHGRIDGLCTPCHDPHGVSRTLEDRMPYALPLLKGTWLTSPYREDGPPASAPGKPDSSQETGEASRSIAWQKGDYSFTNREANANFGVAGGGAPREPMSRAGMKYNVDRNTFGATGRITEDDASFAGLCLHCHKKEQLSGDNRIGRVHRSVKGWGSNKEHSFPCSKCHQAHNSGLPRLMQTNCFEIGPPGLRDNSGIAWAPAKKGEPQPLQKSDATTTVKSKKSSKTEIVGCHVRQFGGSPAKQGGAQWNEKEKWQGNIKNSMEITPYSSIPTQSR